MLPACLRWLIKHCGAAIENLIIEVGFVARLCLAKIQRMGLASGYLNLLELRIGCADSGQPQGLSLRSAKIRKMATQNQSVLCRNPSVSAYAEPASFTQGSRNKILHCYKNCF
jgi:hypothetical protein